MRDRSRARSLACELARKGTDDAHHGGAGTTAAGLRAGVPSALVPHFGDQAFCGGAGEKAGRWAGANTAPGIDGREIGAAMARAVTDEDIRARAAALGARIRAEDGLGQAIEVIEGGLAFDTIPGEGYNKPSKTW